MLVNVPPTRPDPILAALGRGTDTRHLSRGFYVIDHWNFELTTYARLAKTWIDSTIEVDLAGMGLEWDYGVCDTPEQFMERFGPALDASPRLWVVSFVVVRKEDQEPSGGWRWHKWGPYIGDKSPQREYLYNEGPEITQATTFKVYAVLSGALPVAAKGGSDAR